MFILENVEGKDGTTIRDEVLPILRLKTSLVNNYIVHVGWFIDFNLVN